VTSTWLFDWSLTEINLGSSLGSNVNATVSLVIDAGALPLMYGVFDVGWSLEARPEEGRTGPRFAAALSHRPEEPLIHAAPGTRLPWSAEGVHKGNAKPRSIPRSGWPVRQPP
jgi:hypothetical protein